jgi:HK97 family phage major capsid protein/HK97 family phage prohead protease
MTDKPKEILGTREFRSLDLRGADMDDDNRTVEISVSSEMPVERWFGTEILDHDKKSVNLDFFASGRAPLLLDHDTRKQIGVVELGFLAGDEKKLRARVRFGKSALAQEIYDDVKDGIRSNISVGYIIEKIERNEKTNVVKVVRWTPFETSIVSVPADQSVGVGRSDPAVVASTETQEGNQMSDNANPATVPAQPVAPVVTETRDAPATSQLVAGTWSETQVRQLRTDVAEIMDLGSRHNMGDKAREFIREGKTLADFRGHVLNNLPTGTPLVSQDIGMTRSDVERFSVMRLARAAHPQASKADRDAATFEIEATGQAATVAEAQGLKVRGTAMPAEVLRNWIPKDTAIYASYAQKRAINTTDDSALVPEDYRAGSFIDVLRNQMGVMRAGATFLNGLAGNVDIPKKLTASAATWVSAEGGNATQSEPTFGNVTMTPKDLAVYTDITRRSRQQMSPDVEALIRQDIAMAIALGLDLAALEGSAASGQPRGLLNTVGINKPTAFAGVNPTYAEVIAMETAVADDNALMGNLAYITRTNMAGALKTTQKFTGTNGVPVWEPGNQLNGYPAILSNQGTDGNLYFGNWSDLLIGFWSGLDLQFDYAALALSGGLRLIAFQTCDIAVRHAQSFAYNNDTP